ncbi:MAG: acyl-CoA desaturase [Nitrospinales bacterium]
MGDITHVKPQYKFNKQTLGFFIFLHVGALCAFFPFAFSWSAVALMVILHWMTASLGICLGYHRYLTHRSFELPKWLAYTFVLIGTLAVENGPIKWVGQHRMHHAGSDTDRDPHSAKKGFWWSHLNWMLHTHPEFDDKEYINKYTKDLQDDKFYLFLDKYFVAVQVAFGLILFAIGGIPWVVWGIFVRIVLVYQSTWLVNSASHMFGYKNFELENDLSTNCWWVGIAAYGEGWHNNHHAFPQSARHGLRPMEIDATWIFICMLRKLGLATNIKIATLKPPEEKTSRYFKGEMIKKAA